MKQSLLKSPEWWVNFAVDFIDLKGGSVAKDLSKLLDGETSEVKEQIKDHYNKNIKEVDKYPLGINNALTLKQVFVSQAGIKKIIGPSKGENNKSVVNSLIPELVEQLEKSNDIIIVHGQPGHGKTSAMRILARALAIDFPRKKKERPLVLFYEFKELHDLNRNEFEILRQITPFVRNENFFHNRDTVIILDGTDERAISDGDRDLKSFLRQILSLFKRVNYENDSSLKLVLTGRTRFIDQIKSEFPEKYIVYEIEDFKDYRLQLWLDKFNKATNNNLTATELDERHLRELKYQPVLLTICATIITSPKGKKLFSKSKNEEFNRLQVYDKIIKWTYERKNHPEKWNEEQYNSFLQALGFVLFAENSGDMCTRDIVSKFKQIKDLFYPSPLDNKIVNIEDELKTLSICFFFSGHRLSSFSFIHKSIQDYLVSMAIVHGIENICKDFDKENESKSCHNMAKKIYNLLGRQQLSNEDHSFYLTNIFSKQNQSLEIVIALLHFMSGTMNHKYLNSNFNNSSGDPLRTEALLLSNLSFLIFIYMSINENQINFLELKGLQRKLLPLEKISQNNHLLVSYNFPLYLNCSDYGCFHSDLYLHKTILSGSKLDNCSFRGVSFIEANFGTTFIESANLSGTDFIGANLYKANLQNTNLSCANFSEANFSSADLCGANLSEAEFIDANFSNALLDYADLSYAVFRRAQFYFTNISSSNLSEADLREANLNQADLKESDLSHADLRNADLSGADLSGTNLVGVNLQGTNLYGTKIFEYQLQHINITEEQMHQLNILEDEDY